MSGLTGPIVFIKTSLYEGFWPLLSIKTYSSEVLLFSTQQLALSSVTLCTSFALMASAISSSFDMPSLAIRLFNSLRVPMRSPSCVLAWAPAKPLFTDFGASHIASICGLFCCCSSSGRMRS